MAERSRAAGGILVTALALAALLAPATTLAVGVGRATWTPRTVGIGSAPSTFLVEGDAYLFASRSIWSPEQRAGLADYLAEGLRYTQEINDVEGRLSATGFWATDLPNPSFDRDDDDRDGRWEEAEVTSDSAEAPRAGTERTVIVQFSRWHQACRPSGCDWRWDLRRGAVSFLSQLSSEFAGEWEARRYTRVYGTLPYDRAIRPTGGAGGGTNDGLPIGQPAGSAPLMVTFARPIGWSELLALEAQGVRWTAFEAIGRRGRGTEPWTCGGPVGVGAAATGLEACAGLGVEAEGVVAAGGWVTEEGAQGRLDTNERTLVVESWDAPVLEWLATLAGESVDPPDLTLNDRYWELVVQGTEAGPG